MFWNNHINIIYIILLNLEIISYLIYFIIKYFEKKFIHYVNISYTIICNNNNFLKYLIK